MEESHPAEIRYDSVQAFNDYHGFETLHPLVSVGRYEGPARPGATVSAFGIYALFLKETKGCALSYGRTRYDFDAMTVAAFAPGQRVTSVVEPGATVPKWTALVFHPDFLARSPLAAKMPKYGFFSYTSREALHLSPGEVDTLKAVLDLIRREMAHAIDRHTRQIILTHIDVLLGYCLRFYERQFITREEINHAVVRQFEEALDRYLAGEAAGRGLPTVAGFADRFHLSPGYFGELVKTETGRTAQDFIAAKVLAAAREYLSDESLSVSQVAARLGFEYPQHFNRFFKRHTGKTPREYRSA